MDAKISFDCGCNSESSCFPPYNNEFDTCYGAVEINTIGTGAIIPVDTRALLPSVGNTSSGYYIRDEKALYAWDDKKLKYYCIGRDYENIKIINGGDANEFEDSEV